jgi:hypothetical protein
MNKQIGYIFVLISFFFWNYSHSQENIKSESTKSQAEVFLDHDILPIKLSFSIKDMKKETNDSTYIDSDLVYQLKDASWQTLPVNLRARGNNRLKNCFFPPIKVKIKKSDSKHTPFEDHKNLKIVLPCLLESDKNDNIVKEYLAYKLFEIISPYHFKARLLDVEFEEVKGDKSKTYNLKGIFVEDDKSVAKRLDGKIYERDMHPLNQEPIASIRNAFFQFMIGNTDFSTAYQHNMKVIYINKTMVPLPYDFDMAGIVNTSYAASSIAVNSVTERKYRGFVRDKALFEQVRREFIDNKDKLISVMDENATYFDQPEEFNTAKDYILSFFDILVNNKKFKNEILEQARTN